MLARRLLIVLAVLIGLTALAAGVSPRAPVDSDRSEPDAAPRDPIPALERTLQAGEEGQTVTAQVGQRVVIVVEGQMLDTVSLAEFGNETVDPDSPARFELLAEIPGSYPIELLESGRRIGVLEIGDDEQPAPDGVESEPA